MSKKVVLAFSGGLDTSYCAKHLSDDLGYEVHGVTVNTGSFDAEEQHHIKDRAISLGLKSYELLEYTQEFYQKAVRYLIFGNVLKNNTYPLSVSAERVFQAIAIARKAKELGAEAIAHGSTGAGNDQVRFDLIFQTMCPEMEIITPIRDQRLSREAEIDYLRSKGVEGDWKKSAYSINQGLWGTSVGGKETLTSEQFLPDEAFPHQLDDSKIPEKISIGFDRGEPVTLNNHKIDPVQLIVELNQLANNYAIGRDIHVGDTIIGIKGRVGFEAPAALILIKSHHLLEKHVLSKHQLLLKDQFAMWYGNLLHEGQYLDPVMRDLEAFFESTQSNVTGEVDVLLAPYRFQVQGIRSKFDLMQSAFGSYGEMNTAWSGEDVKGFTRIFGNQSRIFHTLSNEQ